MSQHRGDLHRRGPAGEHQKAACRGVPAKIDQHVDFVAADHIRHRGIVLARRRAPVIRQGAEPRRYGVLVRDLGIAEQLHAGSVVRGEERFREQGNRVLAEIRGNVADPQPATGKVRGGKNRIGWSESTRVRRMPATVLREDCLR